MEEEPKKFSLEELKQYNGQDGKPSYIAFNGKIYDVTFPARGLVAHTVRGTG